MTGGLARVPELTHDALAFVLCHELGHMAATPPRVASDRAADEFAAGLYLPLQWSVAPDAGRPDGIHPDARLLPDPLSVACARLGSEERESICLRIVRAAVSVNMYRYVAIPGRWNAPSLTRKAGEGPDEELQRSLDAMVTLATQPPAEPVESR